MLSSLCLVYASLELSKDWDCEADAVAVASGGSIWKGLVMEGMKEMIVQCRQHGQGLGAYCKAENSDCKSGF